MDFGDVQYLPMAPPFFFLFAGAVAILLVLLQLRLLQYAYEQLGVSPGAAVFLLIASLAGSYVNIPIAALWPEPSYVEGEISYFGMRYVAPPISHAPEVILAINVGGAVIPTLLSIYLLSRNRLWLQGLLTVLVVAAVSYAVAEPVKGVGIALPIFVPPVVATISALLISWPNAAALSCAGGSLGVLLGADLLNFDKLKGLGTPILSIGGAGTFDGIFVTGVASVLLASLLGARAHASA